MCDQAPTTFCCATKLNTNNVFPTNKIQLAFTSTNTTKKFDRRLLFVLAKYICTIQHKTHRCFHHLVNQNKVRGLCKLSTDSNSAIFLFARRIVDFSAKCLSTIRICSDCEREKKLTVFVRARFFLSCRLISYAIDFFAAISKDVTKTNQIHAHETPNLRFFLFGVSITILCMTIVIVIIPLSLLRW